MASFKIFWVISFVAHQAFLTHADSAKSLVPGLYVFGDSSVDAGNNNNLDTDAKANMFPYGIDFNNKSTGRFTNGKTFADIIAIKLGLPLPPPYMGLSESERHQVATGINYASGACGILNNTRHGDCLSLDKQIEYFNSTVKNDLPKKIQSKDELSHHLSKSIYLLSVGSNDYVANYLYAFATTNNNKSPEEFADYLLGQLASNIKIIYDLGGRKFVIVGVGPIGCAPFMIGPNSQDCHEDTNQKVKPYSNKLPSKLQELKTQLPNSLFVSLDNFNFFKEIRNAPQKFGFASVSKPCFDVHEAKKPCDNRNQYYYFDEAHSTEAANEIIAKECFGGPKLCFPINIEQLVRAP